MIDLAALDGLFDMVKESYELQMQYGTHAEPDYLIISPAMKHRIDTTISQRPHQRLLRKCQYRRIYRRRKRGR